MDLDLAGAYAAGVEPPQQAFRHQGPSQQQQGGRQAQQRGQGRRPMDEDWWPEEAGELPVVDDLEVAALAAAAGMEALGEEETSSEGSSSSEDESSSDEDEASSDGSSSGGEDTAGEGRTGCCCARQQGCLAGLLRAGGLKLLLLLDA